MAERDEQALRDALRALDPDQPVDPEAARHRAAERRRNGRMAAGVAVALVLVAGVIGVPRLLPAEQVQSTSAGGAAEAEPESVPDAQRDEATPRSGRRVQAPTDPAPGGWRTEYYRDISFQVPKTWGYAVPPQSDWCADEPPGRPRADQRRPYVWLASSIPVRSVGCPSRPASLLTEHIEALSPGPAIDYVEGAVREGNWWVVTRFAGSAVLVVTTKERSLAEQILDSARVDPEDAPCRPSSPIVGPAGTRSDDVTELSKLPPVDWVVLCQYEPVDGLDPLLPRLRASVRLDQAASQALVSELASAPVNDMPCPAADASQPPDLAVLVRIWIDGEGYRAFVNPAGCGDGSPGMTGGIDDGTSVRLLTREVCRLVLTPPLALFHASGDVGRNCVG